MRLLGRFYTPLVPARCKNKSVIFDRGPPVGRPAARRRKNDSRPDSFLIFFGVPQKILIAGMTTDSDRQSLF
jgi:hypothetical protein